MRSMQTNGASKNRDWPAENGTIFFCDFGNTWCWFLGVLGVPGMYTIGMYTYGMYTYGI